MPPTSAASEQEEPALLCAFNYIVGWNQLRGRLGYRQWCLDSGAFAARQQGIKIDIQQYIEECLWRLDSDPTLHEVFALDVIGDWRASVKNAEIMWAAGVPAIPCYHYADDNEGALLGIARDYPKIALGGMADLKQSVAMEYSRRCFARVWPKKIHGFGMSNPKAVLEFPWDSVDSSSWKQGPLRFGRWIGLTPQNSIEGSHRTQLRFHYGKALGLIPDLRPEVDATMKLERSHRGRWNRVWRDAFREDADIDIYLAGDWTCSAVQRRCFLRALGRDR